MTLIRVQRHFETLECFVSFRYDPGVVQMLKDLVPSSERKFDPETKLWTVDIPHADILEKAFINAGHEVEGVVPRPKAPPGAVDFFDEDVDAADATAAAILESIVPRLRGAVFRAMGRALYPDMYPKRR